MRGKASILVIVACMATVGATSSAPAAVTAEPWTWRQTGITGGGFQNVVAADPYLPGTFLVGGELSGYHRTTNRGTDWVTSNRGVTDSIGQHVAALAFSKSQPGTVYAAAGAPKGTGAFLASTDGGVTWTFRSRGTSAPHMSSLSPLCGDHPRATGNLIALDDAGPTKYIYVGTLNDGIKRSTDGGRTWKTIGLNGAYIRTLIKDPLDPSILYAGVCSGNGFSGAYKITQARSTAPVVTRIPNTPLTVEEFTVVGTAIYAAANTSGIFKVTNGGTTWTKLGSTFFSSTSKWGMIDGALGAIGNHILYVACETPAPHGNGMYRSVAKSTDGGATWTWVTVTPGSVHPEIAGTLQPWWLAQSVPSNTLGKNLFTPGQIEIDPRDPQAVLITGRAGVWRTTDGGLNWYPAVKGLGAALTNSVAAQGLKLYAGVGDWTQFSSRDHGQTVKRFAPSGATFGYSVAIAGDGTTFLGPGHRDTNTSGQVFATSDPFYSSWSNLNLPAGKRIAAIGTGNEIDGRRVVLAAVEGAGIWRNVAGTGWVQVATHTMVPIYTTRTAFAWSSPNSAYVYLAVPGTGLFRSTNRGLTWSKIWTGSTLDVAGDPTVTSGQRIYVHRPGGVYRIDDARNGTVEGGAIKPVRLNVPQIGPVAVGPAGAVYVAGTGSPAGFYRSMDRGANWYNHADAFYPRAALFPVDVAVSGDNHFYVALKRNGVIVGTP